MLWICFNRARHAVNVNRKYAGGARGDQRLDLARVECQGLGINIRKHRRDVVPRQDVGRRRKGERRCDDLTRELERLTGDRQRGRTVVEQGKVRGAEVLAQRRLKGSMLAARVGQPAGLPDVSQLGVILV